MKEAILNGLFKFGIILISPIVFALLILLVLIISALFVLGLVIGAIAFPFYALFSDKVTWDMYIDLDDVEIDEEEWRND